MFTLINVLSWILFIVFIIASVVWFGYHLIERITNTDKLRWPTLYPNQQKLKDNAKHHTTQMSKTWTFYPFIFLFLILAIVSGRHLERETCLLREGEWQTWDSGFGWTCINPNLIEEDHNFRVITTEE